jgi:hypothetical protein
MQNTIEYIDVGLDSKFDIFVIYPNWEFPIYADFVLYSDFHIFLFDWDFLDLGRCFFVLRLSCVLW